MLMSDPSSAPVVSHHSGILRGILKLDTVLLLQDSVFFYQKGKPYVEKLLGFVSVLKLFFLNTFFLINFLKYFYP